MQTYTIEIDDTNENATAIIEYMMSLSFVRIVENKAKEQKQTFAELKQTKDEDLKK